MLKVATRFQSKKPNYKNENSRVQMERVNCMQHNRFNLVNYKGELLNNTEPTVAKESFYTINEKGKKVINWKGEFSGEHGFDIRHKEENGYYYMEILLPQNTIIVRYGSEYGSNTTAKGTPYEQLGLPYIKETVQYHEYRIIADNIKVLCKVQRGIVAPIFDSPGGAVQYYHGEENSMRALMRKKQIERVI